MHVRVRLYVCGLTVTFISLIIDKSFLYKTHLHIRNIVEGLRSVSKVYDEQSASVPTESRIPRVHVMSENSLKLEENSEIVYTMNRE